MKNAKLYFHLKPLVDTIVCDVNQTCDYFFRLIHSIPQDATNRPQSSLLGKKKCNVDQYFYIDLSSLMINHKECVGSYVCVITKPKCTCEIWILRR
jgi:hypothetical protein